ncbi:hypothetical protein EG68_04018 [Paragonimus skrjabini miyazakii]|uniref:Uncharacterized protein n=1 Tax=Paragonimus skrjabini miyazakii TaxID=59628 RepID=A0A8S9YT36_9TREM|nr:hypothetical protein EG68_04018 [Paragonimus skrjabini miyazakii]
MVSDALLPNDHRGTLLTTEPIRHMYSNFLRGHQLGKSHLQAALRQQKALIEEFMRPDSNRKMNYGSVVPYHPNEFRLNSLEMERPRCNGQSTYRCNLLHHTAGSTRMIVCRVLQPSD